MSRYARATAWESDSYESDPFPELRELLTPEAAELSSDQIEAILGSVGVGSVEELESFWKGVKKFGRAAGGVLQKALPVVATVAGTALGGPVGAALGGAAGQALSGALGGALSGPDRGRGRRVLQGLAGGAVRGVAGIAGGGAPGRGLPGPLGAIAGAAGPALAGLAGGGSPAAAQLLRTVTRPETLQALLSMAMGGAGRRQVPVGGTPVPAAAFANLLGVLANQAAAEYHQIVAGESTGTPLYLLDQSGEFVGDPADPTSRAEVLLLRFAEADALEAAEAESDQRYFDASEGAESDELWEMDGYEEYDEYDELELAEAYEED